MKSLTNLLHCYNTRLFSVISLLSLCLTFNGCESDDESTLPESPPPQAPTAAGTQLEEEPPDENEEPVDITALQTSVFNSVFVASCNGCHVQDAQGDFQIASPLEVCSKMVNIAAQSDACAGAGSLVVPLSPDRSLLYEKLTSRAPSCGVFMPPPEENGMPRPALTLDQLNLVRDFINHAGLCPPSTTM